MARATVTGKWLAVVLVVIATAFSTGCSNRLKAEREQLWRENQDLRDQQARMQRDLESDRAARAAEVARLQAELDARARAADVTTVRSNTGFSAIEGVETIQEADRVTVRVPGDVLFASGKAVLNESSKKTLAQIARVLQRNYKGDSVRIEGHTDTDPIRRSKWRSNQELSEARAEAVLRYLSSQGVAGSRLSAIGYGSTQSRDTKAKSRRVEIVVITSEPASTAQR